MLSALQTLSSLILSTLEFNPIMLREVKPLPRVTQPVSGEAWIKPQFPPNPELCP